ncbi:hypothetical protein [Symbiobacterium terraclitae]|uniref:hypothetical protein n=1 Tax=Symbiobacterium terraclitae TaxID=557451 RepID=UPI0035B5430E
MTDRQLTPDEQAFLKEVGLHPDDVAHLVDDAQPLPPDALARIRSRARRKAGIEAARSPGRRRWLAAAAAALLLVGGTVVLSNPEGAVAAVQRLVQLVPGIGLTETDGETWILPEPVSVEQDGLRVTVTGVISSARGTQVQFRVDWTGEPMWEKPAGGMRVPTPELYLPDGTVLTRPSGYMSGGSRGLEGAFWFGPLPGGWRDAVVRFPSLPGAAEPVDLPLSLVNAVDAGLAEAQPGGWSDDRYGVQVGVPYWTAAGDRIVLALDAVVPDGAFLHEYGDGFGPLNLVPSLTDERGRAYPLIDEASELWGPRTHLVFAGPLEPDAGKLTLSVPALILADQVGEARLTVPLSRLPEGEPLALNERLTIGDRSFTVTAVTRLDDDTFRFDLDLGPEQDGVLLQRVDVAHPKSPFASGPTGWSGVSENGQMTRIEVDFSAPPARNLEIVFDNLQYRLQGPWEVELPAAGGKR